MVSFGNKEKDSNTGGGAWLKGFKDGVTVVQFAEPVDEWHKYYEHFDRTAGKSGMFVACARAALGSCVACESEDEKTAKASVKWVVNTVDDQGRYNLHKVGVKIKEAMQQREQTKGLDITSKTWEVTRYGKGLETSYLTEQVGPAAFEVDSSRFSDAGEIIARTYYDYTKAVEDAPLAAAEQAPEPAADTEEVDAAREEMRAAGLVDAKTAKPELSSARPTAEWTTAELREYVTKQAEAKGDEAPGPREPRSKLVTRAEHYQSQPDF